MPYTCLLCINNVRVCMLIFLFINILISVIHFHHLKLCIEINKNKFNVIEISHLKMVIIVDFKCIASNIYIYF